MNSRKCHIHGEHGILYVCPDYSIELQKEIEKLGEEFREQCLSGEITIQNVNSKGEIVRECKWKDLIENELMNLS